MNQLSCQDQLFGREAGFRRNSRKALLVLGITSGMMIFEIYFGYITGSMALLADGWHMATHAAALGITYLAYRLAAHPNMAKNFNFGGGKILALGGFASSVFLLVVVVMIAIESVHRLLKPEVIQFNEALFVALIGLVVNLVCAYILRDDHHHHGHEHGHNHEHGHASQHTHRESHSHDHNIRGAYLHVLADALTSIGAIVALLAGKFFSLNYFDPIVGLVGALVIFFWAIGLIKDTGWELLDGHAREIDFKEVRSRIETENSKIIDLHIWKVAPERLACELVIQTQDLKGAGYYREILEKEFCVKHSVIEERKN